MAAAAQGLPGDGDGIFVCDAGAESVSLVEDLSPSSSAVEPRGESAQELQFEPQLVPVLPRQLSSPLECEISSAVPNNSPLLVFPSGKCNDALKLSDLCPITTNQCLVIDDLVDGSAVSYALCL